MKICLLQLWSGLLILTSDVWSSLVLLLISIIALDFEYSYQYVQREVVILLGKDFVFSVNSITEGKYFWEFFQKITSSLSSGQWWSHMDLDVSLCRFRRRCWRVCCAQGEVCVLRHEVNLGLWNCHMFAWGSLTDCMSKSAYQQVESVALPTNIQVKKISVSAVPTC